VGSDAGGIPDLVVPDETGLLATVGDGAAFAQAIAALLDHPDRRAAAGTRARAAATGKFSLERVARQHLEFYRGLLA
jgi:glycosyltransferase involved in cell wall biosynthesis